MNKSAVVLVVDGLGAGFLGPYGNTWLETPAFNRLARESFLVECCLARDPRQISLWEGLPASITADLLSKATLLTDDADLAERPAAQQFAERIVLPPAPMKEAATSEETALAAILVAAADWLREAEGPFLLWIHAKGMFGPWDAPWEMRAALADEEDPPPPQLVAPPEERLAGEVDPDYRLGLAQAYGAQVQVLDECVGHLLQALRESPAAGETLFAVTASRGFPLAEHGRIGRCDQALYSELLHVPLLLRLPDGSGGLVRTQQLLQTTDLSPAIAAWCLEHGASDLLALAQGQTIAPREVAFSHSDQKRALRTPAWFLRDANLGAEPLRELFVKPDDRFEVNEVASRCGEVVAQLLTQLDAAVGQVARGERLSLLPEMQALRDFWH